MMRPPPKTSLMRSRVGSRCGAARRCMFPPLTPNPRPCFNLMKLRSRNARLLTMYLRLLMSATNCLVACSLFGELGTGRSFCCQADERHGLAKAGVQLKYMGSDWLHLDLLLGDGDKLQGGGLAERAARRLQHLQHDLQGGKTHVHRGLPPGRAGAQGARQLSGGRRRVCLMALV